MAVVRIFDGKKFVDVEVSDDLASAYTEMEYRDSLLERRETRRHQSLGEFCIASEINVEHEVAHFEIAGELEFALNQLTEKQRIVVVFYCVHEMSFREIARMLGLNKDTVRESYIAGIKKLKRILKNTPPKSCSRGY